MTDPISKHLLIDPLKLRRRQRALTVEALAGDKHRARDHGPPAAEIGESVGIGLICPGEQEPLGPVAKVAILD